MECPRPGLCECQRVRVQPSSLYASLEVAEGGGAQITTPLTLLTASHSPRVSELVSVTLYSVHCTQHVGLRPCLTFPLPCESPFRLVQKLLSAWPSTTLVLALHVLAMSILGRASQSTPLPGVGVGRSSSTPSNHQSPLHCSTDSPFSLIHTAAPTWPPVDFPAH